MVQVNICCCLKMIRLVYSVTVPEYFDTSQFEDDTLYSEDHPNVFSILSTVKVMTVSSVKGMGTGGQQCVFVRRQQLQPEVG